MMNLRFASLSVVASLMALTGACAAPAGEPADESVAEAAEENVGVTSEALTLAQAKAGQSGATKVLKYIMYPTLPLPAAWTDPFSNCYNLAGWLNQWRTYYGNGVVTKVTRRPNQVIQGVNSIVVRFYYNPSGTGYSSNTSATNLNYYAQYCFGAEVAPFMVVGSATSKTPEGWLWMDLDPEVATLTSTLSTTYGAKASAKSPDGLTTFDAYRVPSSWSTLTSLSGIPAGQPCASSSTTLNAGAALTEITTLSSGRRKCVAAPSSGETQIYP